MLRFKDIGEESFSRALRINVSKRSDCHTSLSDLLNLTRPDSTRSNLIRPNLNPLHLTPPGLTLPIYIILI